MKVVSLKRLLYDSNYMMVYKRKNYRDDKKMYTNYTSIIIIIMKRSVIARGSWEVGEGLIDEGSSLGGFCFVVLF